MSKTAKVSIIGAGCVGVACAYTILQQNMARELCLVDVSKSKLEGELMDLQHGLPFTKPCVIRADTDYAITEGSTVVVITAGVRQRQGEAFSDLLGRNVEVFKKIVPQIVKHSPHAVILVISNPVDLMTYVTLKLSGLPKEQVIGSGTHLDTARFRSLIAESLNIAVRSCHGWIIGEHGESSIPIWSSVNVAGVSLNDVVGADEKCWKEEIQKKVVGSAQEIIKLKGYVSWAIGLSTSAIVITLLRNSRNVFALSSNIKGMHGIDEDVCLSLPCIIGAGGIAHVIKQNLSKQEVELLQKSAKEQVEMQKKLQL